MRTTPSPLINSLSSYLSENCASMYRYNAEDGTDYHNAVKVNISGGKLSVTDYDNGGANFSVLCMQITKADDVEPIAVDKGFVMDWIKKEEDSFYPSPNLQEAVHYSELNSEKFTTACRDIANIAATFSAAGFEVGYGHSSSKLHSYVAIFVQLQDHVVALKISKR